MKTKHQIFFSRKGSIVTSLIALGVITTSTIGFFQYMNQFQANIISTEQAGGQPILMNTILNNMKSLLIENNIDENGIITAQNIHGICSLIKPVSGTRTNEELLIGFSDIKKDPGKNWILERWKVFFPSTEWEIIEDGIECKNIFNENIPSVNENEGSFKRCLKNIPTDSNNVHAAFAIAEIVPEKFNRKENQEHSIQVNSPDQLVDPNDPSSLRGYDPKSIIFRLKTHLAYSSSEEENPHYLKSYRESLLWANDAGRCHVKTDKGYKMVQFSGTGTGTTSQDTIINNVLTEEQKQCRNHIQIRDLNPDITQVGAFLANYGSIGSIAAVGASCTSNRFRCKKKGPGNFDDLKLSFGIDNKSTEEKTIEKMKLTFGQLNAKGQLIEADNTSNGKWDEANFQFLYSAEQSENEEVIFQTPGSLKRGSDSFTLKTQAQGISNLCSEVCQNYKPGQKDTYYYPKLDIDTQDETEECPFQSSWETNLRSRIYCTVCHMKSCHRKGLGTFGPYKSEEIEVNVRYDGSPLSPTNNPQWEGARFVNGLPEEPLDAQVPECRVEDYQSNQDLNLLPESIKNTTIPSNIMNNNCLILKSWSSSNPKDFKTQSYETANCGESKPVLCFINGHYLPALNAPQPGERLTQALQPSKVPFSEAVKTCYEMGKEVGNALELYTEITKFYTLRDTASNAQTKAFASIQTLPGASNFVTITPPASPSTPPPPPQLNRNTKYNFINNATRGLFLAPPNYTINYNIGNNSTQQVIWTIINAISGDDIWVGMELDAGGFVVSTPPSAGIAKDEAYAMFYNKEAFVNNRLTILKDTGSPPIKDSEHLALGYNIRWKGVIPTDQSEALPFVCSDKSREKFSLTTATSLKPQEGHKICEQNNMIFTPPVSALDWTKLMLELNSNDPHYPFPDPDIGSDFPNNGSYIYEKDNIPLKKAWVALQDPGKKIYGGDHSGIANQLRLTLPENTDSLFTTGTEEDIKKKIQCNNGVIKINSSDKSLNFHTQSLVPNITSPKNAIVNTVKSQTQPQAYQVCLREKEFHTNLLPGETRDFNTNCQESLRNSTFKPTSYVFMSHFMEQIMKRSSPQSYLLVADPEAFEDSIKYHIASEKFKVLNQEIRDLCRKGRCPLCTGTGEDAVCNQVPCTNRGHVQNLRSAAETVKKEANDIVEKYKNAIDCSSPPLTEITDATANCTGRSCNGCQ